MLVYEKTAISLHHDLSRIEKSHNFVYAHVLITRKILRSKNAQCKTEELL